MRVRGRGDAGETPDKHGTKTTVAGRSSCDTSGWTALVRGQFDWLTASQSESHSPLHQSSCNGMRGLKEATGRVRKRINRSPAVTGVVATAALARTHDRQLIRLVSPLTLCYSRADRYASITHASVASGIQASSPSSLQSFPSSLRRLPDSPLSLSLSIPRHLGMRVGMAPLIDLSFFPLLSLSSSPPFGR